MKLYVEDEAFDGHARLLERRHDARRAGHRVSTRGALLRASEYYRQAFFFEISVFTGH